MLCPKCGREFVGGIKKCPDCGVPLAADVPPEPQRAYSDLVTVFIPQDYSKLLLAKSLLDAAGIKFFARGENLQHLFGWGNMGGFSQNTAFGPVQIQVRQADEREALEALALLTEEQDN